MERVDDITLASLPTEIQLEILSFLTPLDLFVLRFVDRRCAHLVAAILSPRDLDALRFDAFACAAARMRYFNLLKWSVDGKYSTMVTPEVLDEVLCLGDEALFDIFLTLAPPRARPKNALLSGCKSGRLATLKKALSMGPFEQESRSDTGEVEAEAVEHALHAPLDEARQMVACLAEHFQFQRDRMCSVASSAAGRIAGDQGARQLLQDLRFFDIRHYMAARATRFGYWMEYLGFLKKRRDFARHLSDQSLYIQYFLEPIMKSHLSDADDDLAIVASAITSIESLDQFLAYLSENPDVDRYADLLFDNALSVGSYDVVIHLADLQQRAMETVAVNYFREGNMAHFVEHLRRFDTPFHQDYLSAIISHRVFEDIVFVFDYYRSKREIPEATRRNLGSEVLRNLPLQDALRVISKYELHYDVQLSIEDAVKSGNIEFLDYLWVSESKESVGRFFLAAHSIRPFSSAAFRWGHERGLLVVDDRTLRLYGDLRFLKDDMDASCIRYLLENGVTCSLQIQFLSVQTLDLPIAVYECIHSRWPYQRVHFDKRHFTLPSRVVYWIVHHVEVADEERKSLVSEFIREFIAPPE